MTCRIHCHAEGGAIRVRVTGGVGDQFREGIEALKRVNGRIYDKTTRTWSLPYTSGCAAGLIDSVNRLGPGYTIETAPQIAALAHRHGLRSRLCAAPEEFGAPIAKWSGRKPWAHQCVAARLNAASDGCYFAHDMRTGKTMSSIMGAVLLGLRRILILCPRAVGEAWIKEWKSCGQDPGDILNLCERTVADRVKALKFAIRHNTRVVAVLNYDVLHLAAIQEVLLACEWDEVICDEAHRLKSPRGKGSEFVASLRDRTPHRLALSGTPMQNSPEDFFAQCRFVEPYLFGLSHSEFMRRYAIMSPDGYALNWSPQSVAEIKRLFATISHRVRRSEVIEMPPITDEVIEVTLGKEARRIYNDVESSFIVKIESVGEIEIMNSLTEMLLLQEVTSGFIKAPGSEQTHRIDDGKVEALADLMDTLDPTEPFVVFCRFRADLAAVHEVAARLGRGSLELSGNRKELRQWQEDDGRYPILAVQEQSGGVGIDLTRACYFCSMSYGWSYGQHDQMRARPMGVMQTRRVMWFYLVATDTIDELVLGSIGAKSRTAADIVERNAEARQIINMLRTARRSGKPLVEALELSGV